MKSPYFACPSFTLPQLRWTSRPVVISFEFYMKNIFGYVNDNLEARSLMIICTAFLKEDKNNS